MGDVIAALLWLALQAFGVWILLWQFGVV